MLLMADALKVDVSNKTIDLMAAAGELIHCYSLTMMIYLQWTMMTSGEGS